MPDKAKANWPYDGADNANAKGELDRETEKEHARLAAEATHRQRLRNNRLLVGGRAHTKKPGLS
jgi:hypothetical protein